MFDAALPLTPILLLFAYPIYVLLMAAVLAICGVPRADIGKWALRQADRQRLTDLILAAREVRKPTAGKKGLKPKESNADPPSVES